MEQQKNKKTFRTVSLVIIVGAIAAAIFYFVTQPGKDSCEYYVREEITADSFMGPIISETFKAKVYPNWYKCHSPQRGDIIRYGLGNPPDQYTRILAAVGGDTIQIRPDPLKRGWNLIVNGEVYHSGTTPYPFGVDRLRPTLGLYLDKSGKRTLSEKEIVILALAGPGYNDSGLFGLFETGFARKVELPEDKQKALDDLLPTIYVAVANATVEKTNEKKVVDSLPQPDTQPKLKKKAPAAPKRQKPKRGR